MLTKYIECRNASRDGPVLLRADSIREVHRTSTGQAIINGTLVASSYDEIKDLLMQDEGRVCYDERMDFRIRAIARRPVLRLYKELGGEVAISLLRQILEASTESEVLLAIDGAYENVSDR